MSLKYLFNSNWWTKFYEIFDESRVNADISSSSSTSVTTNSTTQILLDTKINDNSSSFTLSSGSILFKKTGRYLVSFSVSYQLNGTGERESFLAREDVTIAKSVHNSLAVSGATARHGNTIQLDITESDIGVPYKLKVYQTSGSTLSVLGNVDISRIR